MTDESPLSRRTAQPRVENEQQRPPTPAQSASDPSSDGPVPLTEPREGTPEPVTTPEGLADVVARFAAGAGPVALDAERASGYRYSQRAYLVQLRRSGAGTALIDPIPLADLSTLDEAIADAEWVHKVRDGWFSDLRPFVRADVRSPDRHSGSR